MTEAKPTKGRFIVFEGIDGSGKTTQAKALVDWLPTSGLLPPGKKAILTREPGATMIGQAIREMVLDGKTELAPIAELLLFAADRAQHIETVIKPALDRGDWVVCDRFTGSTVAYQGYGNRLGEVAGDVSNISAMGVKPDLVLLLVVDTETALARAGFTDKFEQSLSFMQRVADGYAEQCEHNSSWQRISCNALSIESGNHLSVEEVGKVCRWNTSLRFTRHTTPSSNL